MPIGLGTEVNENGNTLDSGGNVQIDHVWGNIPMQPNDVREENGQTDLLDPDLDNHVIAYAGWSGYPQYTPNTSGVGAGDTVVPSVLGFTTANAVDALEDAGLVVTTATAATNAAKTVTAVTRTSGSTTITITASGAGAAYPVGTKITVSGLTGDYVAANGTFTVTASATNTVSFVGTGTTALSGTSLTGSVIGTAGTIKTQSIAAGNTSTAVGAAITITPWAAGS